MKILKRIGIGLLAIIVLLLIAALFLPKDFRIKREIAINRPKAEVFSYVKQLKNQNSYSKWALMDPNLKVQFHGTDGTPGFISMWEGNDDVGKGEQEIIRITEGERMDTEIRFQRPFESKANAFMATEALGTASTKVTWAFEGRSPWPLNLMGIFMEGSVGDDLQTGLSNLKNNLEHASSATQAPTQ